MIKHTCLYVNFTKKTKRVKPVSFSVIVNKLIVNRVNDCLDSLSLCCENGDECTYYTGRIQLVVLTTLPLKFKGF